jgi:hypothetical protein|mmetsp:Transcript_32408/g.107164  ORF Transcript_32408/g.107164 Transcript_32408/m.107164 type:complete len:100 (+) Transcript_32408:83-382(+)
MLYAADRRLRRRAGVSSRLGGQRTFLIPPPSSTSNKIGFQTISLWGLCIVVLGVCYYFEQKEEGSKPRPLPDDVQRVMPNGSWLMRDGSIRPASDGEKR